MRAIPIATLTVDIRLAWRNILRQPRRSFIALLAIGFGVVAMMLAAGYIEWIYWANREEVAIAQLGHIQVSRPRYHDEGQSDPFAFLLPDSLPALRALERTPGIQAVSPRLALNGLVSQGENSISFLGMGIDPDKDPSMRNLLITQGQRLATDDPTGTVLGGGLAANLGVKLGDTVVLLATGPSGGMNAVEMHVRGLASIPMKAYDDSMLYIPIETAQGLLRVKGAHIWVALLQRTDMTDAVLARLKPEPVLDGLEMTPWFKLADYYNKTVELFSRQIGVVKLIIAVIIVLSIGNTMIMSVMERMVEIGTAMALGVRRRRILGLFLLEGLLLGSVGGIAGIAVGYALAEILSLIGIPMPAGPGMSRGFTATIIVTPSIVWQALLLAVSTTLIASIYPAWRASRLVIVDALRRNR